MLVNILATQIVRPPHHKKPSPVIFIHYLYFFAYKYPILATDQTEWERGKLFCRCICDIVVRA